ncbi:MAG: 3-phosphoshikimate 1-carboxyvinyltransferase [Firmicutes bacterium]|nr:3-phosphoshikimate 1-carboxyvinyltransferase [Bacillota bacterium]
MKDAEDVLVVRPSRKICGELTVPGDKSISHRAVIIGSLAEGRTMIYNFLRSEDCRATISCLRSLGVEIEQAGEQIHLTGRGLHLQPPDRPLYAGNSGTTVRLLAGVLAGQKFTSEIHGDDSLSCRPMLRVTEPLRRMGATVGHRAGGLPLKITGGNLRPISYDLPVASAQVKSAVLLAGLFAEGQTSVREPAPTRDHTERMLKTFKAEVCSQGSIRAVRGPASLEGCRIDIPGDISSAAYFMVAAAVIPGSEVFVRGVGINPTRTGVIDILQRMGARPTILNRRVHGNEEVGDIRIRGEGTLTGVTVEGEIIPRLIDEIPALAVAALAARGMTVIRGAAELRVKESDRIASLVREFGRMGARIEERPDGLIIEGGVPLHGCLCESHGDHRLAMALAIAGLRATGQTLIREPGCIRVSYPSFARDLARLT